MSENKTTAQAVENAPARNKFAARKNRKKMPKWLKIMIALLLLAAVGYGVYYLINMFTAKEEAPVMTEFAYRGTLSSDVTGYGSVVPKNKADYGAKTQGTVTEVYVNAGDVVSVGDKLFSIDPSELLDDLDAANAAKRNALANLNAAIENMENTNVTAPFSGKLLEAIRIKSGDEVSAGTKLGTLVDDSSMLLELYFSHAYIDDIKEGQTANVSISETMSYLTGTVSGIEKVKRVTTDGSMLFRVTITVPNPGTLTKDMTAVASVMTPNDEAFPYEGGKLDWLNTRDIITKVSGTVDYANVVDYGEYKGGASILSVSAEGLDIAIEDAQKTYDEAEKKVIELTDSIENTEILATIDGMVSAVLVSPGDVLTGSGTSVLSISDTSSLFVEVNIDELDVSKLAVGMPATIIYNGGSEPKEWTGTLSYLSFEAKRQENNWGGGSVAYFPAKIAVENDGTLLPNMNVDYRMTSLIKDDCLMVPTGAVIYSDIGTLVYVKNESLTGDENIAEIQSDSIPEGFTPVIVEIGLSDDRSTEIVSGLNDGAEVMSKGVPQDDMMGGAMAIG